MMKYITEINNLSLDEIQEEIKERKELISHMCGSLYPSILQGEIEKLFEQKEKIVHKDDYLQNDER